jgi:hypothetical protein
MSDNPVILDYTMNVVPKIQNLDSDTVEKFLAGYGLMNTILSENFFDIPKLPEDKYSEDGLFYHLDYFDSEMLLLTGKEWELLTVYKIENKVSMCPYRISLRISDEGNFYLCGTDQWLNNPARRSFSVTLATVEKDSIFEGDIPNLKNLRLSELIYRGDINT